MPKKLRVGTRKSALAKTQTHWVVAELSKRRLECEVVEIVSPGDRDRTKPLYEIESEGPGLFTKHLEQALIEDRIDLAVHSLKDLPTLQPPELKVWAVPTREDCADVVVCRKDFYEPHSPWGIRSGATVGTSSLRREALLLSNSRLQVRSIRGNVPTRVQLAEKGEVDAVVLAAAGLNRLGLKLADNLVLHPLDDTVFVSAPGQGALGIEGRSDLQPEWRAAVESLQDDETAEQVRWERHVLRQLEGGCTLPLGVRCRRVNQQWEIYVFLGVHDTIRQKTPGAVRNWTGFHRHSWKGADASLLAAEAIQYFRQHIP